MPSPIVWHLALLAGLAVGLVIVGIAWLMGWFDDDDPRW
jgi:hypothetical protein